MLQQQTFHCDGKPSIGYRYNIAVTMIILPIFNVPTLEGKHWQFFRQNRGESVQNLCKTKLYRTQLKECMKKIDIGLQLQSEQLPMKCLSVKQVKCIWKIDHRLQYRFVSEQRMDLPPQLYIKAFIRKYEKYIVIKENINIVLSNMLVTWEGIVSLFLEPNNK